MILDVMILQAVRTVYIGFCLSVAIQSKSYYRLEPLSYSVNFR